MERLSEVVDLERDSLLVTIEQEDGFEAVLLPEQLQMLRSLVALLQELDDRTTSARLLSLEVGPPMRLRLMAMAKPEEVDGAAPTQAFAEAPEVHRGLLGAIRSYGAGTVTEPDYFVADRIRDMARALKQTRSAMTLWSRNESQVISSSIIEQINALLGEPKRGEVVLTGELRGISDVGGKPVLVISSPIGPRRRFRCKTTEEVARAAAGHLYQSIRVRGQAVWTPRSFHPTGVFADSIEWLDPSREPSAEAFLQAARDEFGSLTPDERAAWIEVWKETA